MGQEIKDSKASGFVGSISLITSKQGSASLSEAFMERLVVSRSCPLGESAVEAAVRYMPCQLAGKTVGCGKATKGYGE